MCLFITMHLLEEAVAMLHHFQVNGPAASKPSQKGSVFEPKQYAWESDVTYNMAGIYNLVLRSSTSRVPSI